jgi:outer membrane protein assembly factor BamE
MRATTFVILVPLLLGACAIHQIDVQQGNLIEPAQLEKLKVGMDKNQARFVLGTPMVADIFHDNRWDYVYSRRREGELNTEIKRVSLFFENDVVARIEITPQPASASP